MPLLRSRSFQCGRPFRVKFLISRRGSRLIADYGGVQKVAPVLAGTFLIGGLATLSLSGLSPFVSEFLVLVGTFSSHPVIGIMATIDKPELRAGDNVLSSIDVSRKFTGWTESAFDVLLRLEGEPSPGLMREVRKDRERLVRQPMVALLDDLAWADPAFEDHSVWRFGKTPEMWQNQSALVRFARNVEINLILNLDGLRIQGAWWYADADQVQRFRTSVAAYKSGSALAGLVTELRGEGFEIAGHVLQRVPRGYCAGHPQAALLRHRSLLAIRNLGDDEWLYTPKAVDAVLAAYKQLRPLLGWLTEHVSAGAGAHRSEYY
jgi:uncharacterized protein (DUF2461 family)